jgi:hypothetical protein
VGVGQRRERQLTIPGDAAQRCTVTPDLERERGRDSSRMLRRGTARDGQREREPARR